MSCKWYALGLLLATMTYGPSLLNPSLPSSSLQVVMPASLSTRSLTLNALFWLSYWSNLLPSACRLPLLSHLMLSSLLASQCFLLEPYHFLPRYNAELGDSVLRFPRASLPHYHTSLHKGFSHRGPNGGSVRPQYSWQLFGPHSLPDIELLLHYLEQCFVPCLHLPIRLWVAGGWVLDLNSQFWASFSKLIDVKLLSNV